MTSCKSVDIDGWSGHGDLAVSDSCVLNTRALLGLWIITGLLNLIVVIRCLKICVRYMLRHRERGCCRTIVKMPAGWRTPFLVGIVSACTLITAIMKVSTQPML